MTPELQQHIEKEAEKRYSYYAEGLNKANCISNYIAGATLYASRVEELEAENKELKERVEKTRTRKAKQLTATEILKQFAGLELADKLKVKSGIEENIKGEQQRLQEQLKLITGSNEKEVTNGR